MIFEFATLLAQETAPAKPGMGGMLVPMILIMVMFYFVLIRPQRKQQKAAEQLRNNLKIGDDVITAGGIHGRVTNKSDKTVTVKVADNTKMKFEKSSITQVFPSSKSTDDPGEDESDSEKA